MSTRKLIAAALICGLAILMAGGIQLVRLSGQAKTADEVLLAVGARAKVGAQEVAVLGHVVDGTSLKVDVMSPSEIGWGVITDTAQKVPPAQPSCTSDRCQLTFDLSKLNRLPRSFVAIFTDGSRSASWSLKG